MSNKLALAFLVAVAGLASGCASVTGSPNQSILVQARDQNGDDVTGANCELYNNKGRWLVVTPGTATVHKSNQDMQLSCAKTGMEPGKLSIESKTLGSMYGNLILGGGVGAIIDHNSGAAYEYPAVVRVVMNANAVQQVPGAATAPAPTQVPLPSPIAATARPLPAAATATPPSTLGRMVIGQSRKPQVGDEWEYIARDNLYGKEKKLLWRVKTIESNGALEELLVDGQPTLQWKFDNTPSLVAVPIDTGFLLAPYWDGQGTLPMLTVKGMGECVRRYDCQVSAKVVGYERISVPAGQFDALRIDGDFMVKPSALVLRGRISFWYLEKSQRLIKQTVSLHDVMFKLDETLELQVARAYQ